MKLPALVWYAKDMTVTFSIEHDLDKAMASLDELRERDIPFIAKEGINKTLEAVKSDLITDMRQLFDKPNSFTLNSLAVWPRAEKDSLYGELGFRDFAGKGTPAGRYLAPQVYGGGRNLKKFEKLLQDSGILPRGLFAVPAEPGGPSNQGAPLDRYGNIPGAYLNSVLSYLRSNRDAYQNRSYTNKRRGASRSQQWFAITDSRSKLPTGIYERQSGQFHMVIKFVRAPQYKVRYPVFGLAEESVQRNAPAAVADAADFALRSLRKYKAQWQNQDS